MDVVDSVVCSQPEAKISPDTGSVVFLDTVLAVLAVIQMEKHNPCSPAMARLSVYILILTVSHIHTHTIVRR